MACITHFKTALFWLLGMFFLTDHVAFASTESSLRLTIQDAANRYFLDPKLVEAIMTVESGSLSKSKSRTSPKGAMGRMQVMPKTADHLAMNDPHHDVSNIMGACEYFRSLLNRFGGNLEKALAAYNAGPEKVKKSGGIPPIRETRLYVKKVLALYHQLKN